MRRGKLLVNGLVIGACAFLFVQGTKTSTSGLLPSRSRAPISTDTSLAALEEKAALSSDVASVAKLASAYLERDQSGLATAVIQKASSEVQDNPEVAHLYARALLHRGKVPEALATARQVEASCETAVDETTGRSVCPAWLRARSARQLAFLEEMSAAGIDDPGQNPEGTRAAFDRSSREVRFVAMR